MGISNSVIDEIKTAIISERKAAGMTQAELAEKVGMTQSQWSKAETGESKFLTEQIVRAFGVLGFRVQVFSSRDELLIDLGGEYGGGE